MKKKKHMILGVLTALAVSVCGFTALAAETTEAPKWSENAMRAESQQTAGMEETEVTGRTETALRRRAENGVARMEILQLPDVTTYYGDAVEEFDISLEGIKLRLFYDNGDMQDVCPAEDGIYDNEWEICDGSGEYVRINQEYMGTYQEDGRLEEGEQKIRFTCGDAEAEFSIQIIGVTGISLKKAPDHTEYCGVESENIFGYQLEGIKLDVTFADGVTKDWNSCHHLSYDCKMDRNSSSLVLTVGGKECRIPITYKTVQSLSVVKMPEKLVYETCEGNDLFVELEGLELQAVFTDGTSGMISGDDLKESRYGSTPCKKNNGEIVHTYFSIELPGRHWGRKFWMTRLGYGATQVELKLDGKTAAYQIQVVREQRENRGEVELGKKYSFLAAEDAVYVYTFTPAETGVYRCDGEDFHIHVMSEQVEIPGIGDSREWLLKAGREYRISLQTWDSGNLSFEMKKISTIAEEEIFADQRKEIPAGTGKKLHVYKFVPKESGSYGIYAEKSSKEGDLFIWLCDAEVENFWEEYYWEGDWEEELLSDEVCEGGAYLTAGQTYDYVVWGEENIAAVEVRKKENTCTHKWELEGDYWCCLNRGWKWEICKKCGESKYTATAPEGHTIDQASVVKEATVLQEGKKGGMCRWCGKMAYTAIPKLTPVLKLNVTQIPLKVKQSTTAVKVTEMAEGDAVASWKSSNPKIAKVTNAGKITAGKKTGKAVITVTLKSGKTAKVTVKVQKKKVATKKIKVAAKKITLKKGQTYTLAPVVTPITTQEKITYSASKKKVASVSKKGVIKAKKPGTSKIKIKSGRKKAVVTVKVTK